MSLSGNRRSWAEDLVQEAFQALARRWLDVGSLEGTDARRWLFTVARNKAVDRIRLERRLEPLTDVQLDSLALTPGPEAAAMTAAQLRACVREINTMPNKRRQIATLVWIDGRSAGEVAALLDLAPSTVRVQLKLARDQISNALGHKVAPHRSPTSQARGGPQ
jgi:RNA polymerase sigma-70 factor (ECF subfamily)